MKLKNLFRIFLAVVMMAMFTSPSGAWAQNAGVVATVQSTGQVQPVEYTDLEAAFAAAKNGDEMKLLADCALAADNEKGLLGKLVLGNGTDLTDVVLDLNGHTISGSANELITVTTNARLSIFDSSTGDKGSIVTTGERAILNVGILDLTGGSVTGATTGIYSQGNVSIGVGSMGCAGTISGSTYGLYIKQGVANISGGTFVATGTGGTGIECENATGFYILGLPTFSCTVADISLAQDLKMEFADGSYAVPAKKIRVKIANDAPYTFTSNYKAVTDAAGDPIAPEDVFVSADFGEGVIGSFYDSYYMIYEAAIAELTEITFPAGTSTYFDARALALYGTNDALKFYGINSLDKKTVNLAEYKSKKFGENNTVIVSNTSDAAIKAKMVVAFEGPMASSFMAAANADLDVQEFPPIFLDGTEDALTEISVPEGYEVFGFSDNSFILLGSDATAAAHSGWLMAEKSKLPEGASRLTILWPDGTITGNKTLKPDWVTLSGGPFTYDGTEHKPTVTVTDGNTPVAVTVTYSNNKDAAEATAENAPTVTVTANAEGYTGSVVKTFTIARKAVTVKADKQKKYAHADDPTLTATVSGLIDADKDKANIIAYTLSRAEGEKTGTYDITPSGDAEQGNYTVSYEAAKLYILHAPSPYGVWVNEIAVTADNHLDILGDGDAANKKAPSVQYFDEENLLVLTNATVDLIESEGDLEVYMVPGSQNEVGSFKGEINDPQDPDENVAQSRTLEWGESEKTIPRALYIGADSNTPAHMVFNTSGPAISAYDEVYVSESVVCSDAKGNIIAESKLAKGGELNVAEVDGKNTVTGDITVSASAIAGAIADAGVKVGSDVTVVIDHSGASTNLVTVVSGATLDPSGGYDPGTDVATATSAVSVHMQDYGQTDAIKKVANADNALSWEAPNTGAEPIYRMYNPNSASGGYHYTADQAEAQRLKNLGWNYDGDVLYGNSLDGASGDDASGSVVLDGTSGSVFSGATIRAAAGVTDLSVESEGIGGANLGAVMDVTGQDLSSFGNLADVLESLAPASTEETGDDDDDDDDETGENPDDNEDKPVFVIQKSTLVKYNGKDKVCTIPKRVRTISDKAFKNCTSIETIILSDKVTTIMPHAFMGCTNLKTVKRSQKSKLNRICKYAFKKCTSLKTFNLYNVKTVENKAFYGCTNFNIAKNKTNKRIYMPVPVAAIEVGPNGRTKTRFTINSIVPTQVVIYKAVPAAFGGLKTRGDGDNAEESELLIYNIQIEPRKIYACNSVAEVTGGEYVGLEYIQEQLPGQKVTGDDADLPKPGDVNGDDVVNAVDIVMTIDHINGGFSATFCETAADMDGNNTIDQADVDEIVKLIMKK